MTILVNINKQIFQKDEAVVSIFDHGFLFGDSVYEVVRTEGGKLFFLDRHLRRLHRSAERIALTLPYDNETIHQEMLRTIAETGNKESYVRLIMTRGLGPLNIYPEGCDSPNMIIIAMPFEPFSSEIYEQGVKISVASIVRNATNATNPDIKSGNYLNNVLAIIEARRNGAAEALMLNHAGELTECSTSNISLVHGEKIRTPHLESGLLQGITREVLLEIGPKNGFDITEAKLTVDDLYSADEVFLSSSLRNVMAITRIDDRIVGNGKAGEVTKRLADTFQKHIQESIREK